MAGPRRLFIALACLTGLLAPSYRAAAAGLVMEEVAPGSALQRSGIEAGDVLLSWRLPAATAAPAGAGHGQLTSPFDWLWVEVELAPRGGLELSGERESRPMIFAAPPGPWQATIRPRVPPAFRDAYLEGRDLIAAGEVSRGIELWHGITLRATGEEHRRLRCWILLRSAESWVQIREGQSAEAGFAAALELANAPEERAAILEASGTAYMHLHRFEAAEESFRQALAIRQAAWGESLSVAASHHRLGEVAWYRDRLDLAAEHHARSLALRQELAPGSLAVADSLRNLGNVICRRGDLGAGREHFVKALEIQRRLAPGSLMVARTTNSLGVVAHRRGELEVAAEHYSDALEIQRRLAPGGVVMAGLLNNLGIIAYDRGDLDLATEYQERALGILQQMDPGSRHVAESLANLAAVAAERGEWKSATEYHTRALEIRQRLAPDSLTVAQSLSSLAELAAARGDLAGAADGLEAALAIQRQAAPHSIHIASTLDILGHVAETGGDLTAAVERYRQSLEIWEVLAPDSAQESETLQALGNVFRRSGRGELAADYFDRSIAALEAQISKLGGSHELRGGFRARKSDVFRDAIELNLELDRPDKAFHLLERSRGQSFLALLAERDLSFAAVIPEDLEQARRRNAVLNDRVHRELTTLSSKTDPERLAELGEKLERLHRERADIANRVRQASPGLGAIQYPRPLDLAQTRKALDPGTVMLSYSVGDQRTELFVVTPELGPAVVKNLDLGAEELAREVTALRGLITEAIPGSALGESRLADLQDISRQLYRRLIQPAGAALAGGERILIIPDGPLHLLPFAALIREQPDDVERPWRYLAEWKPLHFSLSATVYAELRKHRRQDGQAADEPPRVAAFGDPHYPASLAQPTGPTDVQLRAAVRRGSFSWEPLPYTRREVENIATLFENTRTFVGEAASEEHAKSLSAESRIIHFATHSHLDDRFPLSSALVLTIPEDFSEARDNGLLQVWEIFEHLRLDADLVVLSACQSALGEALSGEGLIGISRAFQFAGARSVAATLWSVADQTTPELMARFYRHLRAGGTNDRSLQAAQIELIREPITVLDRHGQAVELDASAPFYWAAFQILGDWR